MRKSSFERDVALKWSIAGAKNDAHTVLTER
jgi:hypothetical protein